MPIIIIILVILIITIISQVLGHTKFNKNEEKEYSTNLPLSIDKVTINMAILVNLVILVNMLKLVNLAI